MKLILFLFFMFVNMAIQAQNTDTCSHVLKGVVLDADTKEEIPHVLVSVPGTQSFTYTDNNGAFHLRNLCEKGQALHIRTLGYHDTTCHHLHQHANPPHIYIRQNTELLDSVLISAERAKEKGTASISQQTLTKADLAAEPMQTLASALSESEGVTFASSGNNVQLPVVHGLTGNRVLVLNNGFQHGFQNWGKDHAPEIDVSSANRVTIVKGAAGVRYGPEALGGAIVVEADPLKLNEPFKTQAGTGFQTNGRGYFVNSQISQGLKKWSYHVGANFTRIGDRHAPDYSLTNSGKRERSINGGLRYHLYKWDFNVYYSFIDQNLALLRSSVAESANTFSRAINSEEPIIIKPFSYDINEPNQLNDHHLGKAEMNWWYADDAKLAFRYGVQLNKRKEFDVRRNREKPIIDLDLTTNDYQLEWKHPDLFQLDGLIGVQYFTQDNDNNPGTGTTPFIPNYNTSRYSGFIIESITMDKNTFEAGIRIDHEYNNVRGRETNQDLFTDEYRFTNITSSLGYIHQVSDNTTFRTNIGTAWRTPNMAELYSFGQHGFKTSFGLLRYQTDGDKELTTDEVIAMDGSNVSPENGYKWINELQVQKKSNTYGLTAYSHFIKDFVFNRPIDVIGTFKGPMPLFIFDQADAFFIGTDLTWQKAWSNSLNGIFKASYLWSKNVKKNEPLINQPPLTTSYKLSWNKKNLWEFESFQLSLKPSYTFRKFHAPRTVRPDELIDETVAVTPQSEIFDFKAPPSGYFLLDIGLNFKLRQFDVNLSIQNLLNTRYRNYLNEMRYFADEKGRNFLFTINYLFNLKSNPK